MDFKKIINKNKKMILYATILFAFALIIILFFVFKNKNKKDNQPEKVKNEQSLSRVYKKSLLEPNPNTETIFHINPYINPYSGNSSQKKLFLSHVTSPFLEIGIDWDDAIRSNLATKENDFSKFQNYPEERNKFSPEMLKKSYHSNMIELKIKNNEGQEIDLKGYENFNKDEKQKSLFYEFSLKPGLKFSNGDPINSDVIVFSFNTFKQVNNRALSDIDSIEKIDENHFKVNSKTTTNPRTGQTNPSSLKQIIEDLNKLYLVPKNIWEASSIGNESQYGTQERPFVSYGKYELTNYNDPKKFVFKRNQNYKKELPFDEIQYLVFTNKEEEYKAFKEGIINDYTPEKTNIKKVLEECKNIPNLKSVYIPESQITNLFINHNSSNEKLKEEGFKKNLFKNIKREQLVEDLAFFNVPTVNFLPEDKTFFDDLKTYNQTEQHTENINSFNAEKNDYTNNDNTVLKLIYPKQDATDTFKQIAQKLKNYFETDEEGKKSKITLEVKELSNEDYAVMLTPKLVRSVSSPMKNETYDLRLDKITYTNTEQLPFFVNFLSKEEGKLSELNNLAINLDLTPFKDDLINLEDNLKPSFFQTLIEGKKKFGVVQMNNWKWEGKISELETFLKNYFASKEQYPHKEKILTYIYSELEKKLYSHIPTIPLCTEKTIRIFRDLNKDIYNFYSPLMKQLNFNLNI
ncbi:ABC transporter substrate-binding protein [Candidatus Phytoplasma pruni]|uniref:Solute-binding protein family 5 domain-containing protein n=1 Tax=Candidatus Phytoplasma pruni TaxID=479893 RepID=A0A851HCN2_9MOLU|nr:ABC transporter substrate-binding protein [Candidatus Phytoplasma pruni]NWN45821.1 hypothetical protein [Candidatus Phytoplasma pruni]